MFEKMMKAASIPRRALIALCAIFLVLVVAGCSRSLLDTGDLFGGSGDTAANQPLGPQPGIGVTATGTKVAFLLPLSAAGRAGKIAKALKEAGELALFDVRDAGVVLVPKDTRGTPDGARLATKTAIAEGARLIIGPLFAGSVRATAVEARKSSVPVVAFSTDRNVAGGGVYLLSFLPEQDITRVVSYAIKKNKRNFAALIPRTAYGTLVHSALANALAKNGGRLVAVERYARSEAGIVEPARKIAEAIKNRANKIDAVVIPDSGQLLRSFAGHLSAQGIRPGQVQFIGTGLWDGISGTAPALLTGGWFAAPPPESKANFAKRFESAYGRRPPRIASLAYDAVSLAIVLGRNQTGAGFDASQITNPDGFAGVDGLFRFTPDGFNQRGLAVMQIAPSGATVISPPASRFDAGAGL